MRGDWKRDRKDRAATASVKFTARVAQACSLRPVRRIFLSLYEDTRDADVFLPSACVLPPPPSAISSISLPVTKQRPKCPADAFVSDTFLPTIQNHRLAATHLSNLARPIDEFIAEQEWSNIIYDCETKWKRVGGEIKWDLKDEL